MKPNLKVQRFPNIGLVCINTDAITTDRIVSYISYQMKKQDTVADIYAFLYENIAQAEKYIIQKIDNEYYIQKFR